LKDLGYRALYGSKNPFDCKFNVYFAALAVINLIPPCISPISFPTYYLNLNRDGYD
jgi:hypothetical protein